MMSLFVMRPDAPVPATRFRSTSLSFAIFRTSGEERTRSPLLATACTGDGAAAGAAGAEARAAGADALAPLAGAAPPITATTVLMVTVDPSANLISVSTP